MGPRPEGHGKPRRGQKTPLRHHPRAGRYHGRCPSTISTSSAERPYSRYTIASISRSTSPIRKSIGASFSTDAENSRRRSSPQVLAEGPAAGVDRELPPPPDGGGRPRGWKRRCRGRKKREALKSLLFVCSKSYLPFLRLHISMTASDGQR